MLQFYEDVLTYTAVWNDDKDHYSTRPKVGVSNCRFGGLSSHHSGDLMASITRVI